MVYQAVLFDLDGTLLDTLEDIANSANRALASLGLPAHPLESYRRFVGDGVQKLIARMLPEGRRDAQTAAACLDAYRRDYAAHWNVRTRPYDGIAAMLDAMVASGMKLAVLSNKPDEFTQLCVRQLLPRWRFDVVMGASARIPHKPDPAGAIEVARRLGVAAERFAYLGDSGVDMKTAAAGGMYGVGALWGFRQREELESAGARALAQRPCDVVELLDG